MFSPKSIRYSIVLYMIPAGILALSTLTSCIKDDASEQLERERREREIYLNSHNITVEPTASGLYFVSVVEGTGESPTEEGWVDIEVTAKLVDGRVFSTTDSSVAKENDFYNPKALYGPSRFEMSEIGAYGLFEGLQYMKEGGEAILVIPSEINGYYNIGTAFSPPYSTHVYEVKLVNAFQDPDSFEIKQIEAFLEEMEIPEDSLQTSPRSVYYYETQAGSGDLIKSFDSVFVWYTGKLIDGRQFETNRKEDGEPFGFLMPALDYIEGWGESMYFMSEGSRGLVIIPYELAWGAEGRFNFNDNVVVVPPYMTVVFDIEVEKVVRPDD